MSGGGRKTRPLSGREGGGDLVWGLAGGDVHTAELIEKLPRKASRYLRRAKKNTDRPKGQSVFLVGEDGFPLTGINFDSIFPVKKNTDRPKGQSVFLVGEDGFEPSKALPADLQSVPFGHSGIPPYAICQKVELVDGLEPPTC